MILSLIAALFVLLVAAFWAFQGVFSSAIMLFETIAAVMIAFGFYEPLAAFLADKIPEYHSAVALVLIFVVTLVLLRLATDKLIAGNVQFPLPVDRAGGALLGLLTGLLVIGMALIGVQMLPVGPELLGFQRIPPQTPKARNTVWLNPDGFTIGLVNLLSSGRFGGTTVFADARPAFLEDLAANNLGVQVESRRDVPPQSLAARNYWFLNSIDEVLQQRSGDKWQREFKSVQPDDPARHYLVVRVGLDASAADEPGEGSTARVIRFTPAQFRIVGRVGEAGAPSWHMACGLSDLFSENQGFKLARHRALGRIVRWPIDQPFALANDNAAELLKDGKYVFDVAFEVPQDFKPIFVEFKSGARAELNQKMALAKPPPAEKPPAKPAPKPRTPADEDEEEEEEESEQETAQPAKPKVGEKPPGRTSVATAIEERTGVSSKLPMPLKRSAFPASGVKGGKFAEGHIVFNPAEASASAAENVTEFAVPGDVRMVQIGAEAVFAGSLPGQVLEYAKRAIAQISIESDSGERYFAIGVYTAATIGGKRILEIQYWPEADVPERCLEPANHLKPNLLRTAADQGNLKMGFVFLVPPGTHIVKFHSSPRNSQEVNIEVPD